MVCTVEAFDLVGGGVEIVGDDTVVADVEPSDAGDGGRRLSVSNGVGFLVCSRSMVASAIRSFSCVISASIFKSASSSCWRCVSIRRFSRSCSPCLISSSSMTPRSIETLYFDSRSSIDESLCRACLSKSSFSTSLSRNLS